MKSGNQIATKMQPPPAYQSEGEHVGEKYKNVYKRIGITQVCFGVIAIALAITNIVLAASNGLDYYDDLSFIGAGIWGGVMILVCGILGIVSWKKPFYCPIIASMVLSIITSVVCAGVIGLEVTAAIVSQQSGYYECNDYDYDTDERTWNYRCISVINTLTMLHSILAAFGLAAFITAIVHSSYCCASVCCGRKTYQFSPYAPLQNDPENQEKQPL